MKPAGKLTPRTVMNHGRDVSYYVCGNPNASETIFFVNGVFSEHNDWIKQKRKFQNKYRLFFFDYVNVRIEKTPGLVKAFYEVITSDIRAILNHEGIKKTIMISHSLGGSISLYFTQLYPEIVDKIVLINSGVEVGLRFKIITSGIIKVLEEEAFVSYLYYFTIAWWYSNEYLVRLIEEENGTIRFDSHKEAMTRDQRDVLVKFLYCGFKIPQVFPRLESVDCPVLLVSTNNDLIFPVEKQKEHFKGLKHFQIKVFDNVTHNIHIEAYEKVNSIILSFLSE